MTHRKALLATLSALAVAGAALWASRGLSVIDLRQLMERNTQREPDVIFVATPPAVVQAMLNVARVTPNDVVIDLGSGDGRIVIAAARDYGARGIGIELDSELIEQARQNARQAAVTDRVQFLQKDLFEADLSTATVVTLYLMPNVNLKLRSKLSKELKPGTRVVSHAFDMGEWKPDRTLVVEGRHVYFWIIP